MRACLTPIPTISEGTMWAFVVDFFIGWIIGTIISWIIQLGCLFGRLFWWLIDLAAMVIRGLSRSER